MPGSDDQVNKSRHSPQAQLWLVEDVVQYLRISAAAVYKLAERSEIPHIRIFQRKGLRFHPDEIEQWARFETKTNGTEAR